MEKGLPIFEILIDENENAFVDAIALVDRPAIESDFLAFNKDLNDLKFETDDERHELIGPALIPDINIYRKDANGEGYYVSFSKDTIRQIAQIFMKRGFQKQMNIDHTSTPADSFVYQSFIVDKQLGVNAPKNQNIPDGSWVVGVKVNDDEVWNDIKAGKQKGFSVEGLFKLADKKVKQNNEKEEEDILNLVKEIKTFIKNKK